MFSNKNPYILKRGKTVFYQWTFLFNSQNTQKVFKDLQLVKHKFFMPNFYSETLAQEFSVRLT